MKALEKDRNRRYETANGLARDVERFLADEVVEATIRNALGTVYFYLGQFVLAADQYRKAIEIRTKELGLRHPDALQSRFDFASAILPLPGRMQESIEMEELTLKLRREVLGEEHPDTLLRIGNLASAYVNPANQADKAEQLLRQLLPISRYTNGELHDGTTSKTLALSTSVMIET